MPGQSAQPEWYYVGHYGQLGPLTLDQMQELAMDGVITHETYVWRTGMSDWTVASSTQEFSQMLSSGSIYQTAPVRASGPPPAPVPFSSMHAGSGYGVQPDMNWNYIQSHAPLSDKKRLAGGLLNIFLPFGIGRFYLGYMAHGVLQLFLALFCGVGIVWSIIDGIFILAGGVKLDGYGRRLED